VGLVIVESPVCVEVTRSEGCSCHILRFQMQKEYMNVILSFHDEELL